MTTTSPLRHLYILQRTNLLCHIVSQHRLLSGIAPVVCTTPAELFPPVSQLRAESEPSAKAVKKRKKKKGEPKDKPARLPAANPCSQEAESSAESTSESSPGQEAVSEGNAEQKGDGKGVANLAGSARCEGGDGVVRREPEGGVTAEGNDSTKGTAIEEPELQEEETGPSPADRLR